MVLFQKLFQGYIFCFLGDSFGWYLFEQYARETNLKKKRSVILVVYFTKKILGNDAASLQNNGQNSILEAAKGCLKASMDVLTFLDLISKYYILKEHFYNV